MVERGRVMVALTVVVGHALFVAFLIRAMKPEPARPVAESMMMIDFALWPEAEPEPERVAEPEVEPAQAEAEQAIASMPTRTIHPRERTAEPMQAVIAEPGEPEPAQWRLPPSADPFARPPAQASTEQGFGRRDQPSWPSASLPRVAGEAPLNPIIPEQRMRRVTPQGVVHAIGAFIGGGPNAPVEAPCGGRVSGGGNVSQGFSPAWNKYYGCAEDRDPAAFDGTIHQPPGTVRTD